jgi:hypothetical protein
VSAPCDWAQVVAAKPASRDGGPRALTTVRAVLAHATNTAAAAAAAADRYGTDLGRAPPARPDFETQRPGTDPLRGGGGGVAVAVVRGSAIGGGDAAGLASVASVARALPRRLGLFARGAAVVLAEHSSEQGVLRAHPMRGGAVLARGASFNRSGLWREKVG